MARLQRFVEDVEAGAFFADCAVCKAFFEEDTFTSNLADRPTLLDIRGSGEVGCTYCKTSWESVSQVYPAVTTWHNARVFGRLMERDGGSWVRIGIQDTEIRDQPRQWVDIWDSLMLGIDSSSALMSVIPYKADSEAWYKQLKEWIRSCDSDHQLCRLREPQSMPTRLIDVLDDSAQGVVLRETFRLDGSPYTALSHCWGVDAPIRTTASNIDGHKSGIPWKALPLLYQNAITITRRLKVRYIWIDSLCIIQQNVAEWNSESTEMASYYGNAWLTIAADASPDSSHGCFPSRVPEPVRIQASPKFEPVVVRRIPTHMNMKALRVQSAVPLFQRAWTLQERLLSTRILHLGPNEMVWECRSNLHCECGDPPEIWNGQPEGEIRPFLVSHHNAFSSPSHKRGYWDVLLEMYMMRSLTKRSDKLRAMEGLAKQVAHISRSSSDMISKSGPLDHYVMGIWLSDFPTSLLWTKLSPSGLRSPLFPSWSWASITGSWTYQGGPPGCPVSTTAIKTSTPAETWDIDMPLTSQKFPIAFSAKALAASLHGRRNEADEYDIQWKLQNVDADFSLALHLSIDIWLETRGSWITTPVLCVELGIYESYSTERAWGLILQAVADVPGIYERVGVIAAGSKWFDRANRMDVTII